MASCVFAVACSDGLSIAPPNSDPATVYHRLELNTHAVLLDPTGTNSTFTLIATPRAANGDTLQTASPPTFVAVDSNSVRVAPNGRISVGPSAGSTFIIASQTVGSVTLRDSVMVQVGSAPATITSFSIQPIPPDSTNVAMGAFIFITPQIAGMNVDYVPVHYRVSDRDIIPPYDSDYSGMFSFTKIGTAMLYASATVGGVTWTDSVSYTVGIRPTPTVMVYSRPVVGGTPILEFRPATVYLPEGGYVTWLGQMTRTYSIEFDKPANADSVPNSTYDNNVPGNIAPWQATAQFPNGDYARSRRFTRPDTIAFHSKELNASGKIIVLPKNSCEPFCQ